MTDRLSCCVPFCKRTRHNREGYGEWICSTHWPMTDRETRKKWFDVQRRAKRKGWTAVRIHCENVFWSRLKQQAIERAMGI